MMISARAIAGYLSCHFTRGILSIALSLPSLRTERRPKNTRSIMIKKYTAVKPVPIMQKSVCIGKTAKLLRKITNSAMNPIIPGIPALAIAAKIINEPVTGNPRSGLSKPLRELILRVPVFL